MFVAIGRFLIALYFAFTTITTIGYGDIIPNTNYERVIALLAMVGGSATYAYGMPHAEHASLRY